MSNEHFDAMDSMADWGQQFAPMPAESATEVGAEPDYPPDLPMWRAFLLRQQTPLTILCAVVAVGILIASKG